MDNVEKEFTELVKDYKQTIYTVCYFYSKDAEEVNDFFQEILINLWRGFPKFRGESNLKTWVYRVSLNTCTDEMRKKKRRVATIPLSLDVDFYQDEGEKSKQIQQLHERINRLNVFDKAVILLWLENMSYSDIADVIGISVAAVTTRLHRIREQLKAMSNK